MHRHTAAAHLRPLHEEEDGNDGEENHAQELEIVEKRKHGGLALNDAVNHALGASRGSTRRGARRRETGGERGDRAAKALLRGFACSPS